MRVTLTMILGVFLAGAVAHAQAGAPAAKTGGEDRTAVEKQLVANERAINDAFAKKDAKAFFALVDRNAPSVDMNGVMKAGDLEPLLAQAAISSWKIDDARVQWVDANTAVVYYRWTGSGTFAGQPVPSPVNASSVWTKKAGKWMAVFHQESMAASPGK